jgi:putative ABC transport system ATP-binding protein
VNKSDSALTTEKPRTYRAGDVDVHALQGANLDVEKSEFVSIVGVSGSGKSTLFNILGSLTPPTSGTVRIDGKDLGGWRTLCS